MRDNVPCEFPAGYDGTAVLDRLAQVLDPELDELILDLGFVRSLRVAFRPCQRRAAAADQLVRGEFRLSDGGGYSARAADGGGHRPGDRRLGDHCAAAEIEAAVNDGRPFAEAFPGEGAGSLAALRLHLSAQGVSRPPAAPVARVASKPAARRR